MGARAPAGPAAACTSDDARGCNLGWVRVWGARAPCMKRHETCIAITTSAAGIAYVAHTHVSARARRRLRSRCVPEVHCERKLGQAQLAAHQHRAPCERSLDADAHTLLCIINQSEMKTRRISAGHIWQHCSSTSPMGGGRFWSRLSSGSCSGSPSGPIACHTCIAAGRLAKMYSAVTSYPDRPNVLTCKFISHQSHERRARGGGPSPCLAEALVA